MSGELDLPPGFTVAQGGAGADGDYPGGEGWFYCPSATPSAFYGSREHAIEAAWAEYGAEALAALIVAARAAWPRSAQEFHLNRAQAALKRIRRHKERRS